MFLFKKIVAPLFFPLTFCLILMIVGLILVLLQKKGRLGKILLTGGILLLALLSYNAVANRLIAPLECRYPPITLAEARGAQWIAVLGAGTETDKRHPAVTQLSRDSLSNLAEGIHLHRQLPGSRLLLSGGAVFDTVPEAEVLSGAARELGVNPQAIHLETASRDTEDQARLIRNIVGREKCIVVASASHMPRAMALFRKAGINVVAAPSSPCLRQETRTLTPQDFYPNPGALQRSQRALYEYLGIVWAKLRGKI